MRGDLRILRDMSRRRTLASIIGRGVMLAALAAVAPTVDAVVISEIHFHPPAGDERLEFIELANDSSTPEDISGYSFVEGIVFEVPAGTILRGKGILVICADVDLLTARHGITNAIGNFEGALDDDGERLTLVDHTGRVVQSVRYRARGKWPVAPDGTGHTLVLLSVHLDSKEPESWTQSPKLGGSPGLANFSREVVEPPARDVVGKGSVWRYAKGTAPFSTPAGAWLEPGFDDSGWIEGPSGFGFGDDDDATVLDDMRDLYASIACRKRFQLSPGELEEPGDFFLAVDFDDGFCAFVNGTEVASVNCAPAGPAPAWNDAATGSREAGSESLFPVPGNLLVEGENVLAIAGYNLGAGSSDFSLIPRLIFRGRTGGGVGVVEETIIPAGAEWSFARGTTPFSAPPSAWREPAFDDSAWPRGPAGYGFRTQGESVIAYEVPVGTVGNQSFGGALGMDFDVISAIEVPRLGVFDSGSDGLSVAITARLHDRDSGAALATILFTPESPGEIIGGSRFKSLPEPLPLPAGFHGTIVAAGYGDPEPNGNQGFFPMGLLTHDGGGAVSFTGSSRYGVAPGAFPDQIDQGPADRYAAGTFELTPPGGAGGQAVAPPGCLTLLADMQGRYTSAACRRVFNLTRADLDALGDLLLGIDYDDGFCAWINGVEVARANCGNPGEDPAWNAVASRSREPGGEELFLVSRAELVEGPNVLAIAGYNASLDDPDFELTPRLFLRRVVGTEDESAVVMNELFRSSMPGGGWIEIYNPGTLPVDLSGHALTESGDRANSHVFPQGTALPPRGFLVVSEAESGLGLSALEVQLFLLDREGLAVAASTWNRAPPPGIAPGTFSECRFPDGGAAVSVSLTPTRGAANRVDTTNEIVISEIFYHPPDDRPGEFLELYNRGNEPVDLSGFRFDSGIDYTFHEGTALAPGAYLVVAKEPDFILEHHGIAAHGPYQGVLSNAGELVSLVDRLGNTVDEVRYFDGGRWSQWADGGGSSLELIDPAQDNSFASAWDASDESEKAAWEMHSFHVEDYVPAAQSELHLYLVERGVVLVDDVSIRRDAGPELIPNGGFEVSTAPWIIGGTHVRSRRVTQDSHTGAASLEVSASGRGDTLVNRLETDTSPALTRGPYDVSLWARWQRGSSLLAVHGEYSVGPYRRTPCFTCGFPEPSLSGNPLAAALRLDVPLNLGTPGAENSVTRRLREETGGTNLGPVIDGVRHDPPLPKPGLPVTVTARISDSGGVARAQVFYRAGSAGGAFEASVLEDDGLHGDGRAGDGLFGGQLPGFVSLTRIVFYIEAVDTAGAARRFPVDAPRTTCLFLVAAPPVERLDAYHIVMDAERRAELSTRQLHSNDILDAAFVFEDERAHYNTGVRYRGSPWGRPSLQSLRVRFPEDDLFHRGLRDMNISKTGAGPSEGAALFLIGRNAIPGKPTPCADYLYVRPSLNGASLGTKAMIEAIDSRFVEKWYGEDSRGPLLKAFGRFVFNDGGGLTGQGGWEGASLIYRGENPENYRGYFVQSMDQSEDDWESLMELTRMLDPRETPDEVFDERVGTVVDLDSFFRQLGGRMLVSDCDGFGINNGHNGYLVRDSATGLWSFLPFDVECSFVTTAPNLLSSADPGVARLLTRAPSRRAYLRVLSRYLDGYWSSAANPLLDAYQAATGLGTGGIRSHIQAVVPRVRALVGPLEAVPFRIVTSSGADFTVDAAEVELEGEAPVQVEHIVVSVAGGEATFLSPLWTTPTRWRATFGLGSERNEFEFLGLDGFGGVVGSVSIVVTTTLSPRLEVSSLSPDSGPRAGGTRVLLRGSGFAPGLRVFFGGAEASLVSVKDAQEVEAVSPPAPLLLPPGGKVDVELRLAAARLSLPAAFTYEMGESFLRGDSNGDGKVDLSDAVTILGFLFLGAGDDLECEKAADMDDDGGINISDPIYLLAYLFLSGPAPPAPLDACGEDSTPDSLSCERASGCEG